MSEGEVPGVIVLLSLVPFGFLYLGIFNRYVGRSVPLFVLSVAVGWLFLLQSRLYLQYAEILETGRWVTMGLVAAVGFLAAVGLGRSVTFRPVVVFPFLVMSFMFVTTLWSIDPPLTVQRAGSVALLGIAVVSALWYTGNSPPRLQQAVKAVLIPVTLLFWVLTLIYGFDTSYYVKHGLLRTPGPMLNPNGIAGISAVLAPAAYYVWRENKRGRILWMVTLLTFAGMVFLSGTRGALAALVLAFGFVALARARSASLVSFIGFSFAFVGYLIWEIANVQEVIENYLRIERLYTGSGRWEAWSVAVDLLRDRLWSGYGFGTEDLLFGLFGTVFLEFEGTYVHNSFLGLSLQIGVVAATVVFLWILSVALRGLLVGLRSKDRMIIGLEATLIAGIVLAMTESWFYSAGSAVAFPFWILFGVLMRRMGGAQTREVTYRA